MPIRWHIDDRALLVRSIELTARQAGFNPRLIEKDYFCSVVLEYLAASEPELTFKGGTCLAKIHSDFYRLSEDLDFSISTPLGASRKERSRSAEAGPGLAAVPPARRGSPTVGGRTGARDGPTLPGRALGGQRQVELHRLAGAPADRAPQGRRAGLRLDRRGHRPSDPRPSDPRHDPAVCPGRRDGRPRRPLRRPAAVHRGRQEDHHLDRPEVPVHPRRDRERASRTALRHRHRRGALQPGRANVGGGQPGIVHGGRRRGRRDDRGPHQPDHGGPEAPAERELFRVHRDAQEQDAGAVRRGVPRWRPEEAPAVPLVHDEAGHPGGLHPGRARPLHAGRELLPAREDRRGRPGVRREASEEEAPPLRGEPRPRHPAQGRDHGRPLPGAGAGALQDRRHGAGDGGDERHRAGHPVLPRDPRLPPGEQEPSSGDRRVLG